MFSIIHNMIYVKIYNYFTLIKNKNNIAKFYYHFFKDFSFTSKEQKDKQIAY